MEDVIVILFIICGLGWIPILALCGGIYWIIEAINDKEDK